MQLRNAGPSDGGSKAPRLSGRDDLGRWIRLAVAVSLVLVAARASESTSAVSPSGEVVSLFCSRLSFSVAARSVYGHDIDANGAPQRYTEAAMRACTNNPVGFSTLVVRGD